MATSGEPAVGIDLGTTFSVVAHLDAQGRPCTIPSSEGDLLTPSAVFFDGVTPVVGKEALKAAAIEPDRVARFAKRDMGNDHYSRPIGGELLPPEVIQSFILQKLKEDARLKLGHFEKCVITVPAFFNEPRRKATQDAGALAGLDVIDIINEPTAAAIAFGVQEGFLSAKGEARKTERILVYDLGGGTFDVTLMEIEGSSYNAVATAGDVFLGGIDWDQRLVDYLAAQFVAKHPSADPRQDPAGCQRLLREAEDAKRSLSAREQTTITFEFGGHGVRVPVTRGQFEQMTADLVERTRFTVRNVLEEAGLTWQQVTRVILVGGSTRLPMIQQMLEQEWGRPVDRSLSVDEAVAHGAAIYAGVLLGGGDGAREKVTVRNVNSHDLGILGVERTTGRPRNKVMIPRNSQLPATKKNRFKTYRHNQSDVVIKIVEGGDASGQNSTAIGKCIVRDLPPGLPAGTPVEVTFTYAENGRLKVRAHLPSVGRETHLTIERASGMSADALAKWDRRLKSGGALTLESSGASK